MNQHKEHTDPEPVPVSEDEAEQLWQCLPKTTLMGSNLEAVNYQRFWCSLGSSRTLKNIITFQRNFHAKDTDLIISSLSKTGTTWLKSLLYSVVNRAKHPINESPLLSHNPHELVYHLEVSVYGGYLAYPRPHQLNELPSPRLLQTHMPYASLPESIQTSDCKIIYIARNPMDTLVSYWHFFAKMLKNMSIDENYPSIEVFFQEFCEGRILWGPYFEHVVGYWKQSLELQNKVLFLKYEDLKDDPVLHLKRLADFVGCSFTPQEEKEGIINEIIELCNINNMKEFEVNKKGRINKVIDNETFFRKGEVGDWINYFTPSMTDRMKMLMEEHFGGLGLSFKLLPE